MLTDVFTSYSVCFLGIYNNTFSCWLMYSLSTPFVSLAFMIIYFHVDWCIHFLLRFFFGIYDSILFTDISIGQWPYWLRYELGERRIRSSFPLRAEIFLLIALPNVALERPIHKSAGAWSQILAFMYTWTLSHPGAVRQPEDLSSSLFRVTVS